MRCNKWHSIRKNSNIIANSMRINKLRNVCVEYFNCLPLHTRPLDMFKFRKTLTAFLVQIPLPSTGNFLLPNHKRWRYCTFTFSRPFMTPTVRRNRSPVSVCLSVCLPSRIFIRQIISNLRLLSNFVFILWMSRTW